MKVMRRAALAASFLVLASCANTGSTGRSVPTTPAIGSWGFDITGIDATVRPGDDFFRYAGGSWMKTAVIPDDRSSWGGFTTLVDKAQKDVKAVLEENAAVAHEQGTIEQKVADFHSTYQDVATLNAKGLEPARADLDAIANAKSHAEIAGLMAVPGLPGGPLAILPGIDAKRPDVYLLDVVQSGLGLPDRDYYLRDDQQFRDIRAAYKAYIAAMLKLAGYPNAEKHAADIVKLETAIARDSWPTEKRRDRDITYNVTDKAGLEKFAPGFPWQAQLDALEVPDFNRFNINETDAIQKLARDFSKTSLETWKAYMTFHYLDAFSDSLPEVYDQTSFAFTQKLTGQKVQPPRWRRSISVMENVMGEAVGQLYVRKYFSPEAKAAMVDLVENLRAAYKSRIEQLDWMSPETKAQALEKLASFGVKIGYPDNWKDYGSLDIVKGDALGNAKRLALFEWRRNANRLDKPVDKTEWLIPPQQVNAYYMAPFNEIVFPAAILQAPFFDAAADPAINYGGIGGVIGHEMGHGFDDQGAKVDGRGVQRNWWTKLDEQRFKERTEALAGQYSAFEPLEGIHVNGEMTLGENIGDLGGLSVAHEAYLISQGGKEAPVLDGFSGEQRFFLGWAQVWRSVMRDQALRDRLLSDVHSPAEFRVNGVVRNMDSWYDAFTVTPDQKLYLPPEKRVHIW